MNGPIEIMWINTDKMGILIEIQDLNHKLNQYTAVLALFPYFSFEVITSSLMIIYTYYHDDFKQIL